jgi:hypothetical protein
MSEFLEATAEEFTAVREQLDELREIATLFRNIDKTSTVKGRHNNPTIAALRDNLVRDAREKFVGFDDRETKQRERKARNKRDERARRPELRLKEAESLRARIEARAGAFADEKKIGATPGRAIEQKISRAAPFVAIDSEGCNFARLDDGSYVAVDLEGIDASGVKHVPTKIMFHNPAWKKLFNDGKKGDKVEGWTRPHGTFLWAAGNSYKQEWLIHSDDNDKRLLTGTEILEWLVSLPEKFGKAHFVAFSFNYDVTMLIRALLIEGMQKDEANVKVRDAHVAKGTAKSRARTRVAREDAYEFGRAYNKAEEIHTGKYRHKDTGAWIGPARHFRCVQWGDFGIAYLPRKQLRIVKYRDPQNTKAGRVAEITIHDVFPHFQSSFVKALDGFDNKIISAEMKARIKKGKDDRADMASRAPGEIMDYTKNELIALALVMDTMRAQYEKLDAYPKRDAWFGPGPIVTSHASTNDLEKHKPVIQTCALSEMAEYQAWSLHAYFGGRIEMMKIGVSHDEFYGYDIASAYPHITRLLPNMSNGNDAVPTGRKGHMKLVSRPPLVFSTVVEWRAAEKCGETKGKAVWVHYSKDDLLSSSYEPYDGEEDCPGEFNQCPRSLKELRAMEKLLSDFSLVSIVEAVALFPEKRQVGRRMKPVPYFPLPYRDDYGAIFFPNNPAGRYMVEEVRAALRWAQSVYGDGDCPGNLTRPSIALTGAWRFIPANDVKPLTFIADIFEERAALDKKDPRGQGLKLIMNSYYGKIAQGIGGLEKEDDDGNISREPPKLAQPWYAAAITAGTRAMLLDAARGHEDAIIQFATDGIATLEPLDVDIPRKKTLGKWEGPNPHYLKKRRLKKLAHDDDEIRIIKSWLNAQEWKDHKERTDNKIPSLTADMSEKARAQYNKVALANIFRGGVFVRSGNYLQIARGVDDDLRAAGIPVTGDLTLPQVVAPPGMTIKTRGFSGNKTSPANVKEFREFLTEPGIRGLVNPARLLKIEELLANNELPADFVLLTPGSWAEKIIMAWRKGTPAIMMQYTAFKTLGAALASKKNFDLIGCWINGVRLMHCDDADKKRDVREIISDEDAKIARAMKLQDTRPGKLNWSNCERMKFSRPRQVEWIDKETGEAQELGEEIADIVALDKLDALEMTLPSMTLDF